MKFIKYMLLCLLVLSTLQLHANEKVKVLFLGDSLTEGYGVPKDKSYPQWVKKQLAEKGVEIEVLNGSISGSTTASSLSRLKWFVKAKPALVFLALGANDGLRGIKVEESKKNLEKAIVMAKEKNLKVVLAGMMVPPNYGPDYGKKFRAMYPDLAKKHMISLLPFLLEGVAGEKKFNQEDGIHPNEDGHEKMGKLVTNFLYPILTEKK